jgi:hypothetical protein
MRTFILLSLVGALVGACSESSDSVAPEEVVDAGGADVVDGAVADISEPDVVEPCDSDGDCDDGNPCTANVCAVGAVCETFAHEGVPCDDGDECTSGDFCNASGQCVGQGLANVPDDPCTVCACSSENGITCEHAQEGTTCVANPSVCTVGDACQEGQCLPGATAPIDDGNPCTEDSCDKGSVVNTPLLEGVCDDGNSCTTGDFCKLGNCEPGDPVECVVESCASDAHCEEAAGCVQSWLAPGAACEDGNACTSGDACDDSHECSGVAGSCDDQNPCTVDSCDPMEGSCLNEPSEVLAGLPCVPGGELACFTGAECQDGACVPQGEGSCDDGDPCTFDECLESGCDSTSSALTDGEACELADPCAATATCYSGSCTKEIDVVCDDGLSCTVDECVADMGCQYTVQGGETITCGQENEIDSDGCCCFAADPTGVYDSAHVLDLGPQGAGTQVTCCITSGFSNGCDSTAYIGVSAEGAEWTEVDSFAMSSVKVASGGWEAVCVDIAPNEDFRFVRGANDNCYVDHFLCTVPCEGAECLGLEGESCDDGNSCTYDSCGPDVGCAHEPVQSNACLILADGNNLVSFSRLPEEPDLGTVLGDAAGWVFRIMGEGTFAMPWGDDGELIGNLELERTAGYWVTMDLPEGVDWVAVTLPGDPTDPDIAYQLDAGIESVSFPCEDWTPIIEAMGDSAPLFEQWVGQGIAAFKPDDTWIGSLTQFQANDGYEVLSNEPLADFRFTCADNDGQDPYTYGCTDSLASNFDASAVVSDESCTYAVPEGWNNPGYVDATKSQAWALFYKIGSEPGDALGAFSDGKNLGFTMLSVEEDGSVASHFATVPIQVANQGVDLGPITFRFYDASEGTTEEVGIEPDGGAFEYGLNAVTHFGCKAPEKGNYASWADVHADICQDMPEP